MAYDLKIIQELCEELGFPCSVETDNGIDVRVGSDATLCFRNAEDDNDSLAGFAGTPSHTHGSFDFTDARGYFEELDYLDVLLGLKDGRVLICERWKQGTLQDRWLVHYKCNDEFGYLEVDEQIVIWRAVADLKDSEPAVNTTS